MRRAVDFFRVPLVLLLLSSAIVAPVLASGYFELAQAESPAGRPYLDTAKHYESAALRLLWRPDLYELAGHAYYHAKEYGRADAMYRKGLSRQALSPDGWLAWGDVIYLEDRDARRAINIWEQGLGQQNPSPHLYNRLAMAYEEQGDLSAAVDALQSFLASHPEDASAHYRLGLLKSLAEPDMALPDLMSAARLDPQLDPAVQTLRTALNLASLESKPSEGFVIIGRALGLVDEWPLAMRAFEEAVKANEKNAEAWAWLGEAYQQTGRGGKRELDQAVKLNPLSITVRGVLGLYYQRQGNYRQALAEFQAAAALEPKNPAWQASIGEQHSKLGDLIRALEAFQRAAALAPDEATYWRLLATFCAQNEVQVREVGLPAAERAARLAPKDPLVLDVLGWSYLLSNRPFVAELTLVRTLKDYPRLASSHLHLAMLYLQQGKRPEAYDHLVQARDLGSGDAVGQEAIAILQQNFP